MAVDVVIDLSNITTDQGFVVFGKSSGDHAGNSVANAGDINGDGFDDLLIGAPDAHIEGVELGEVYVVFGRSGTARENIETSDFQASDGFTIRPAFEGDIANIARSNVSSAGDINNDGIADFIIGADNSGEAGEEAGTAYVIFGKAGATRADIDLATFGPSDGFKVTGKDAFASAGASVAPAGDVNGDGIDDIIVGAPGGLDGFELVEGGHT